MKRSFLPLNALRVFDAAARHLSFTKAADELAVTPAAVGQQIRALEDMLGVVLFRRLTRNLELTPEAERALPALRSGFLALEESVRELQSWQGSRTLTIAAPADVATHWLMPRLAEYRRSRPELALAVVAGREPVDFTQTNVDVAIFRELPEEGALRSVPLGSAELVTVAAALPAPGAAGLPRISQPGADWTGVEGRGEEWTGAAGREAGGEAAAVIEVSDDALALDAAVAGLGAARVPRLLAERALAEGRLVRLGEPAAGGPTFRLAAPEPQWRQAKVRALVGHLTGADQSA